MKTVRFLSELAFGTRIIVTRDDGVGYRARMGRRGKIGSELFTEHGREVIFDCEINSGWREIEAIL